MSKLTQKIGIGLLSLASIVSGCNKEENKNLKYLEELYMEHYDLMELRRYSINRIVKEDSLMGVEMTSLINYYKDLESKLTVEEKIEADKRFNMIFGYEHRKIKQKTL